MFKHIAVIFFFASPVLLWLFSLWLFSQYEKNRRLMGEKKCNCGRVVGRNPYTHLLYFSSSAGRYVTSGLGIRLLQELKLRFFAEKHIPCNYSSDDHEPIFLDALVGYCLMVGVLAAFIVGSALILALCKWFFQ